MNQPEMEYWIIRLDRLEQENRRLKILGSIVVFVLSVVLLTGATQIDPSKIIEVIRARQITLVDKDGTARAGMGILPDGTVTIGILDTQGTLRTGLRLSDKGSTGLTVHVREGKAVSLVAEPANGMVRLALTDENLNVRAALTVAADGSPSFVLRDKEGNAIVKIP
jgi:2-polyprenyl-6-methoxyphenol hydroxylase-like FAD-dependent oxidoreductase